MKHWIALATAALALAACNTMQGFGQDMKEGGQAIQKAADPASTPNQQQQPQAQYPEAR